MATYTKLKSGAWGVRVAGATSSGSVVSVTTKSGKTKSETVAKVLWSGNGVSICAIVPRGDRDGGYVPAVRNSRGYVVERGHYEGYCGYECPVSGMLCCPKNGPCHDCA